MAKVNIKGLLSGQDKRQFLREIYEESVVDQVTQKVDSFSNEEFYGGECPYCKEKYQIFVNLGHAIFGDRKYVKAKCDGAPPHVKGCGKTVYIKIRVLKEGDMLMGYRFTPQISIHPTEEIIEKYGKETGFDAGDLAEIHEEAEKRRENETEERVKKKKQGEEIVEEVESPRPRLIGFKMG